jgi:hypothetical protein
MYEVRNISKVTKSNHIHDKVSLGKDVGRVATMWEKNQC